MELPMNYHKDRYLNIDILFVNKNQMFLMLPLKDRCMYFETLFSKHNKYILNILQQLIQSQRLKNVFTILEGAFKNMNELVRSNLHIDLIKYITDSQVHTTNDTRRVMNELMQTLEYRYIVREEDTDVFNVTYERLMYIFRDVVY